MSIRGALLCLLVVGLCTSSRASLTVDRRNATEYSADNDLLLKKFMQMVEAKNDGVKLLHSSRQGTVGPLFGSVRNCIDILQRRGNYFSSFLAYDQSRPIIGAHKLCRCMFKKRNANFPDRYPTPEEAGTAFDNCVYRTIRQVPRFDIQYACFRLQEQTFDGYKDIFKRASFYLTPEVAQDLLPYAPVTLGSTLCRNTACPITADQLQRALDEGSVYDIFIDEFRFKSGCQTKCARDFFESVGSTYCKSRLTYSGLTSFALVDGLPFFGPKTRELIARGSKITQIYSYNDSQGPPPYDTTLDLAETLCGSLFPSSQSKRCCFYKKAELLGLCCRNRVFDCSDPDYAGRNLYVPCVETGRNTFVCNFFTRSYVAVNGNGRGAINLLPGPNGEDPAWRLEKVSNAYEVANDICARYNLPYTNCCSSFIQPLYNRGFILELPIICQDPCSMCGSDQNCVFSEDRAFCVECDHFARKLGGETVDCCTASDNQKKCVANRPDNGKAVRCSTTSTALIFEDDNKGDVGVQSLRGQSRSRNVCKNMDFFVARGAGCEVLRNANTGELECVTPYLQV